MLVATLGKSGVEQALLQLLVDRRIVETGFLLAGDATDLVALLERLGFENFARSGAEQALLQSAGKFISEEGESTAGESGLFGERRHGLTAFAQAEGCFAGGVDVA